ncbi:MAG: DNA polymerase Y family protein [Polyangiaceae bacterium]
MPPSAEPALTLYAGGARPEQGATAELEPVDAALGRRIVALVLPALLCELAETPAFAGVGEAAVQAVPRSVRRRQLPLGVVVDDAAPLVEAAHGALPVDELPATAVLSAVNEAATRYGVRVGQSLAEAKALLSRLVVRRVPRAAIEQGLARVAEVALAFGATVSLAAPDTVWVDVTGAAHLFGGEAALLSELVSRVRETGHRVRAALSSGPLLAQAFARFAELGAEAELIVPHSHVERELSRLPVRALGLSSALEGWLVRLGVLTVAALRELPSAALSARLDAEAPRVLDLIAGRDDSPLVPYVPARTLSEESSWDEGVDGSIPLLFVLRGLSTRLGARLAGRGEAARSLVLEIAAERSVARFRGVSASTRIEFTLPKPLWKSSEIYRIVASKLERLQLGAPSLGLRLEVPELAEAMPRQLELGFWGSGASQALDELPIVLAELAADIGEKRIGVLKVVDSHRPELASTLVPALPNVGPKARSKKPRKAEPLRVTAPEGAGQLVHRLTRLLLEPVPFEAPLRVGATVVLERRLYTIESLRFEQRLEAVEWWLNAVNRDYVRVELRAEAGLVEGLVFVDRNNGKRYFQGVAD